MGARRRWPRDTSRLVDPDTRRKVLLVTHVPVPEVPDASLGAALTGAREAAGMTIEQVSAATRIRSTLVRDLEADRFDSSGATVYARGHIRAIAGAVGAEAAALLAIFDAAQGRPTPGPVEVPAPSRRASRFGGSGAGASGVSSSGGVSGGVGGVSGGGVSGGVSGGSGGGRFGGSGFVPPAAAPRERSGPRWGVALLGAGAVLVTVLAIGVATGPGRSPAQPDALSTSSPSNPVATAPTARTPAPDSLASKPPVTDAQLRVRLISGSSWVSIRNATTTLFEGVLAPGQFKDFRDAARLKVIVGNAAAVDLNCGGKDSGPAGGAGQVLRFYCTKDGLAPA